MKHMRVAVVGRQLAREVICRWRVRARGATAPWRGAGVSRRTIKSSRLSLRRCTLLVVACANIAGTLLVRGVARA